MENKKRIELANIQDVTPYNFGEYNANRNRWIDYGIENDYPSYLRNLYLTSPTHQAIVDGTQNLATGEGVEVIEPEKNPLSNQWLNKNFPKEVVKKLIGDLKIYGYAAIQIYDGSLTKYSEAIKYRFDVCDENGQIKFVWFSNDWDDYQNKKNRPVKIPLYYEGCQEPISILIIQLDKHGFDYYSPVDYNASINYISLESEISKYHLANIKNGLFPSFVINFVGVETSVEMMEQNERAINRKYRGSENVGRAIISYANSKDEATTIQTIDQPNIDATYTFLSKESSEKILIGHGVTSPLLFGITRDTGNGLGSNAEELAQAYYLFYESKLKHYQNYIIDGIKKIMNGNMLYADIQFKTYNPFSVTEKTQQLSKINNVNEINSQKTISKIDLNKIKTNDILISENIFDGELKENCYYKFVKSSNNNNMIIKKFELLDKDGYLFKADKDLITNTKDYYFIEQKYFKK